MSSQISFDAAVGPGSTEYYGRLSISNIRYADGSPLKIENFISIAFKSPAAISTQDVSISPDPWVEFTPEVTNEQIDSSTFRVVGKLSVHESYTASSLNVDIGVNGDLTGDSDRYIESVVIAVDSIPE